MPIKKNKQDAAVVKELKELSKVAYDTGSPYFKPDKFTNKFAIWQERTTNGITENRVVRLFIIDTQIDEFPESIGQLSEIDRGMLNLCRCGTCPRVRKAIRRAAELQKEAA